MQYSVDQDTLWDSDVTQKAVLIRNSFELFDVVHIFLVVLTFQEETNIREISFLRGE